jgi:hypothetical protein
MGMSDIKALRLWGEATEVPDVTLSVPQQQFEGSGRHGWLLRFGTRGIVVSKARMKAIQDLLGFTSIAFSETSIPSFSVQARWIDLLVRLTYWNREHV